MNKRWTGIVCAAALLALGTTGVWAAEDGSVQVHVTIANGKLEMAAAEVTVTDTDGDGVLTIHDALYAAHEAGYTGGAAAGYASAQSEYGLSLTKLWGVENGGSYGYYVNNASAMSLADPVQDGDTVNAFVYTDTTSFSDVYCFFSENTAEICAGTGLAVHLSAAGFDENWAPVTNPVAGAEILVDGVPTGICTDVEGNAVIQLDEEGTHVISASSTNQTLVPPVLVASVVAGAPQTADTVWTVAAAGVLSAAMAGAAVCWTRRRQSYAK